MHILHTQGNNCYDNCIENKAFLLIRWKWLFSLCLEVAKLCFHVIHMEHHDSAVHSLITEQCNMMERPRHAEYSKHPCDYIFNRGTDSGESSHLYAEKTTTVGEHLFYQLKKEITTNKINWNSIKNNSVWRKKNHRRVMNHTHIETDTHKSIFSKGGKTAPAI